MPLGQRPIQWWQLAMEIIKFGARLPLAFLAVAVTLAVGWLGLLFVFRLTQYLTQFLDHPWGR